MKSDATGAMMTLRAALLTTLCFVAATADRRQNAGAAETDAVPARVDFMREIRPILSSHCFACHGPDENARQGELRLDIKEGAFGDRGGYAAVVAGKPAESELLARISADDADERMPPPDADARPLSDDEVQRIERWIREGATWRDHWAFVAPKRPLRPQVVAATWPRNEIDYFILARAEGAGLTPAREADRRTLIRRVTFDLTGLPPTPEEVEAFVRDLSPGAYERVVERLLASPHYGEHMARFWLDAARYGDTHGLHLDNYREMWPYRDWVIEAFNSNIGFDQFTTEQLAGDLLPHATLAQRIASGFNRCHVTTNEGGSIVEEVYVRNVDDRVETTGTVFMGLTVGCCVCHDHKFDPLATKEFYSLFAFFNSLDGKAMDGNKEDPSPIVRVPTADQQQKLDSIRGQLTALDEKIRRRAEAVDDDFARWDMASTRDPEAAVNIVAGLVAHYPLDETEGSAVENLIAGGIDGAVRGEPVWKPGKTGNAFAAGGDNFIDLGDTGDFSRTDKFSFGAWIRTPADGARWSPIGKMDNTSAARGYGLSVVQDKVTVELVHDVHNNLIKVTSKGKLPRGKWHHVLVTYNGSSKASGVRLFVNGKPAPAVVNNDALTGSIRIPKHLRVGDRQRNADFKGGLVDDVRIYSRRLSGAEVAMLAGADPIRSILRIANEQRKPAQRETLRHYYLDRYDKTYRQLKADRAARQAREQNVLGQVATTLVFKELEKPREAFILTRGQYNQRGEKVTRGTPAVLPPMADDLPRNRLGLARWLLDPAHPLTARVTVNRYWQQYFGTGIVKTAEDFGSQGEPPSHPLLLDWLAVEFRESGWDIKRLQKMIVMSATYRQDSRMTTKHRARDPENRLLARGPRFRLDAEMLRDQALSASGLLVRRVGGPSVKPPQPEGLWHSVGYTRSNTARFSADTGEKVYRRSLYTFWKRTAPPPQMSTLDAPSRESCRVRRERTNTPLQALLLMNEPQFVESARVLAERAMREGGHDPAGRATFAFSLVTARPPTQSDLADLLGAYREHLAHFREDRDAAQGLIHVGNSEPDETLDSAELAAWTMVTNLILNLDETITKG